MAATLPDPEPSLERVEPPAAGTLDRALVYEHLCQLSELRDARLLGEEQYLARRARALRLLDVRSDVSDPQPGVGARL